MTSVRLVNMIPNSSSGEIYQDSEPQVAVNPSNPDEIVATAFTAALGGAGPLYLSTDRGNTWSFRYLVPGGRPNDQSVRFADSGMLYAGTLRGDRSKPNRMEILRAADVMPLRRRSGWRPGPVMTSLMTRDSSDQPYVTAMTVGKRDYVFVTNNDSTGATVDHSDHATSTPPAGFLQAMIDQRRVTRDSPSVRTAPHENGTVYAAFCSWASPPPGTTPTYATAYIVVARDDNFGIGATPFRDLIGSDGKPGVQVAVVQVPFPYTGTAFTYLGQQRVGSSLSLAVDPRDSSSVFIAWGDGPSREATQTLRVRWSGNEGQIWSDDLLVIPDATNPALAITRGGRVALLYQQLVRRRLQTAWETHVQVTQDYWATPAEDILLARTWDTAFSFDPFMGDYADLISFERELFGVFSAHNYPDNSHFPVGVRYQRNADFGRRLLLNVDGVTSVSPSVDPYFFEISWPRF
jgi:hypothetical protein